MEKEYGHKPNLQYFWFESEDNHHALIYRKKNPVLLRLRLGLFGIYHLKGIF
jgi:hypothetical protein